MTESAVEEGDFAGLESKNCQSRYTKNAGLILANKRRIVRQAKCHANILHVHVQTLPNMPKKSYIYKNELLTLCLNTNEDLKI